MPASIDFTPSNTFAAMAKIMLGAVITMAALAVLSLLASRRRLVPWRAG